MIRNLSSIALLILAGLLQFQNVSAQKPGCDITVILDGYTQDSIYFGFTYGRRIMPQLAYGKNAQGAFHIQGPPDLPEGMYSIIYVNPETGYLDALPVWVLDSQRTFTLKTNLTYIYDDAVFTGSPENALLFTYQKLYKPLYDKMSSTTRMWKIKQDSSSYVEYVKTQDEFATWQQGFIAAHPESYTADLVRNHMLITPPVNGNSGVPFLVEANQRYQWMRKHFFDKIDPASQHVMQYPFILDMCNYYFIHFPQPNKQSIIDHCEDILNRMSKNETNYQFYFKYIVNSLANMTRFQSDEAYIYFVENYIHAGKTPFIQEEYRLKSADQANRLKLLANGVVAPELKGATPDKKMFDLHQIQSSYTLLIFWLPTCSHCQAEMTKLIDLYKKYQNKGLKVVSFCGKGKEDTPTCWETAKNWKMPTDWILCNDPDMGSGFQTKYSLYAYPRIFLLDANKKIIYKMLGDPEPGELEAEIERVAPEIR